jgi:hypothetical protein
MHSEQNGGLLYVLDGDLIELRVFLANFLRRLIFRNSSASYLGLNQSEVVLQDVALTRRRGSCARLNMFGSVRSLPA